MLEIVFGFLLYFVPLVGIPLSLKKRSHLRLFAFLVLFVAPLIGEVAYVIFSQRQPLLVLFTSAFWINVLLNYPLAIFPLGLWAVLIALIFIIKFQRVVSYDSYPRILRVAFGSVIGGIIGTLFMWIYTVLATLVYGIGTNDYSVSHYILSGLLAGIVCGFIGGCFLLLKNERLIEAP